jgi:hypothetical protein
MVDIPRGIERLHDVRLRAFTPANRAPVTTRSRCRTTSPGAARSTRFTSAAPSSAITRTTCSSGVAERLRLQLARRLLRRRQRLPGEPEPADARPSRSRSSRCAGTTSPGRPTPLQPLDVWYGRDLRPGRVAGRPQPEDHATACASTCRPRGTPATQNARTPTRSPSATPPATRPVPVGQAARRPSCLWSPASASTGTWRSNRTTQVRGAARASSRDRRSTSGSPTRSANTGTLTGFRGPA